MEKKYKLIKEIQLPIKQSANASSATRIFREGMVHTIGEWTKQLPWLIGDDIANMPSYFELVEEKEFTRSDMIAFGEWISKQTVDINTAHGTTKPIYISNRTFEYWLNTKTKSNDSYIK